MGISVKTNLSALDAIAAAAADMSGVLDAGAQIVAEAARGACPVDTGRLRASIEVSADGNSASVTAGAPYAAYVEFGTWKMAAQPFLTPALLNNSGAAAQAIISGILGGI